nr:hypothetical protein [uncultured Lachnoclostridium sp.]
MICFYLFLFCTVLALFGTQYIMVVSLVTVLFQTNYRKRKSWASLVRAAAAQLGLGLLAWIATWSFPLSVGLNLIVPFALVFLKATRFNKMGYFSGLMTFTFLQLLPVDLAGFFVQTGAMLYSLACFFLLVKLYQRRYPQENPAGILFRGQQIYVGDAGEGGGPHPGGKDGRLPGAGGGHALLGKGGEDSA